MRGPLPRKSWCRASNGASYVPGRPMPTSSPRTASQTGWWTDPPAARIALVRAALAIERVLPRLWPALGFIGFYLARALAGLFAFLRWPLQALLLAATITAIGLAVYDGFEDFAWPRTLDAARRLERDSGLKHRPISERHDVLVGDDAFSRALWALHRARPLPGRFRIALPHADIAARDPHGLRWFVVIALFAGLVLARGNMAARLTGAFDTGAGAHATLDGWIDPPPSTRVPPTSSHMGDDHLIPVPHASVL